MRFVDWEKAIVERTEKILTWRKRRRLRKKAKQKRKNQLVDWIQALLWAAVVVLIINQYLLQAYAVPSGSMEDTILGDDRLFVNKAVYGPELVPGYGKLPGATPRRGEIVVFLNPNYKAEMGREVPAVEELFNRLIYMVTFTLVNRDVTPTGEVAKHFLVKRLMGQPGERLRMREGRLEVREVGETVFTPEENLKKQFVPLDYTIQKKFYPFAKYGVIRDYVSAHMMLKAGVRPENLDPSLETAYLRLICAPWSAEPVESLKPDELDARYRAVVLILSGVYDRKKELWPDDRIKLEYHKYMLRLFGGKEVNLADLKPEAVDPEYKKLILRYNLFPSSQVAGMSKEAVDKAYQAAPVKHLYTWMPNKKRARVGTDEAFEGFLAARASLALEPFRRVARNDWARRSLGWYIPTDRFFPMGDNRDNSKDARDPGFGGPARLGSLLGKSLFRFWPLNRLGAVD